MKEQRESYYGKNRACRRQRWLDENDADGDIATVVESRTRRNGKLCGIETSGSRFYRWYGEMRNVWGKERICSAIELETKMIDGSWSGDDGPGVLGNRNEGETVAEERGNTARVLGTRGRF